MIKPYEVKIFELFNEKIEADLNKTFNANILVPKKGALCSLFLFSFG